MSIIRQDERPEYFQRLQEVSNSWDFQIFYPYYYNPQNPTLLLNTKSAQTNNPQALQDVKIGEDIGIKQAAIQDIPNTMDAIIADLVNAILPECKYF